MAGNSDAKIVICEDAGQVAKIEQVRGNLEHLEHVVLIEGDGATTIAALCQRGSSKDRDELSAAVTPSLPRTRTRSSTPRARPAPPRASSSATVTALPSG